VGAAHLLKASQKEKIKAVGKKCKEHADGSQFHVRNDNCTALSNLLTSSAGIKLARVFEDSHQSWSR
jgi:hypothetical protein